MLRGSHDVTGAQAYSQKSKGIFFGTFSVYGPICPALRVPISNCQSCLDKIHVVWLKGIVILSAAVWQGDDTQAETSIGTGTTDSMPGILVLKPNRSSNVYRYIFRTCFFGCW